MSDIAGLSAEFRDPEALAAAAARLRAAGYRKLEALTPFPVAEVANAMGEESRPVAMIAAFSALGGGALMALLQWWAGVDYPLDIGGRPQFPWPAFISTTLIVAILWGALGAFVGLFAMLDLPRLHHPAFDIPGIEGMWDRRFFLLVLADDPRFDPDATAALLGALGPMRVDRLPV